MNEDRKEASGKRQADAPDLVQESATVAEAAHLAQQGPGHVLQGQVEIGAAALAHGVDEVVAQARGVEVQQPHPRRPFPHGAQQRDQAVVGRDPGRRPRGRGLPGTGPPARRATPGGHRAGGRSWRRCRTRRGPRTRGPGPPGRPPGHRAPPPRPARRPPSATSGGRGRRGWHKTRSAGRSLRRPSRRPRAPGPGGGAG